MNRPGNNCHTGVRGCVPRYWYRHRDRTRAGIAAGSRRGNSRQFCRVQQRNSIIDSFLVEFRRELGQGLGGHKPRRIKEKRQEQTMCQGRGAQRPSAKIRSRKAGPTEIIRRNRRRHDRTASENRQRVPAVGKERLSPHKEAKRAALGEWGPRVCGEKLRRLVECKKGHGVGLLIAGWRSFVMKPFMLQPVGQGRSGINSGCTSSTKCPRTAS